MIAMALKPTRTHNGTCPYCGMKVQIHSYLKSAPGNHSHTCDTSLGVLCSQRNCEKNHLPVCRRKVRADMLLNPDW